MRTLRRGHPHSVPQLSTLYVVAIRTLRRGHLHFVPCEAPPRALQSHEAFTEVRFSFLLIAFKPTLFFAQNGIF